MEERNTRDVAYLDIAVRDDGKCFIEIMDNGELAKILAKGMVQDDNLLGLLAEAYILYQEKIGTGEDPKIKN